MIVFDGVSIDSVAPVMVEDIRVSPLQLKPIARDRAIRFGADFVRMGGGERTIAITFAVLDMNRITRHESLMNISQWAKTDRECVLELPIAPTKYLQCVCTAKPEPSTRMWWENKLRLTFTCYENPYWTSKGEKTVACGTQFVALGDAPPLMQIKNTFANDASNVAYGDGTNTMTFSTIPAGNMVIDVNRQTAAIGNTSIMQYYQPAGNFIVAKPGKQTITGTGTVYYRERWE